jgi:hypothetical protein
MTALPQVFSGFQQRLMAELATARGVLGHPVAKGDAAETRWLEVLRHHLPHRYSLDRAHVIDAFGGASEQQDIVIYDRQYAPLIYNHDGQVVVPAEAVYAVIEVKQELNKANVEYAGKKAASVRRLKRTSAPIPMASGTLRPTEVQNIVGALVSTTSGWKAPFTDPLRSTVDAQPPDERLDLGLALDTGAFELHSDGSLGISSAELALVTFFIALLRRLQRVGTAPAIDWSAYERAFGPGGHHG